VNDILQDKEGFMWFATDGGLSKFNGQNLLIIAPMMA
jgi:ligand-binding sensor domain-containing protein